MQVWCATVRGDGSLPGGSHISLTSDQATGAAMLRATGRVGRVTRKAWAMEGKSGTTVTARLIVGDVDFLDVKIPEAQVLEGVEPKKGELVDWGVVAMAGERGRLSVNRALDWSEVVGDVDTDTGELRAV